MEVACNELSEEYKSALLDYLDKQGEGALERAWELGRRVVASDLGLLELAAVHQEIMESVLAQSCSPEDRIRMTRATDFFLQCLSPFEMVHRGVKEANVTLRRLHHSLEQHVLEQQLLHQELEFAQQVQKSLLPAAPPEVSGYRFYQYYQPARVVGGDYFDYMVLPGHRLAVAVGDVAGKGMPAALLMARVITEQRYCLLTERTTSEALTWLNRQLAQYAPESRFVTSVLAILDLDSHELSLANAGHMPPLLRRKGSRVVEPIGVVETGLPLGVAFNVNYKQAEISLRSGDIVLIFTDGLTEARNASGEFYHIDRVSAVFSGGPTQVGSLAEAVLADVKQFAAGKLPHDDLTLIGLGRETSVIG